MKAPQGACVLTSTKAREQQYEDLLSSLDDQVWKELSDDWQKIPAGKRRKSRLVNPKLSRDELPEQKLDNFRL